MGKTRRRPYLIGCLTVLLILAAMIFFYPRMEDIREGLLPWIAPRDRIALVEIKGVINKAEDIVDQLKKYADDRTVKGIVIRIDSPGGAVVPAQEIYQEILSIRERGKPVVASLGSIAASGGYYIASATDRIIANPGTITGSIGVIMALTNIEELLGKIGLKAIIIKSGRYKDIGSPLRPLSEEERRILQGLMDNVHLQFIEAVARGRGLPIEKVKELADGRIFSGQQARELGLVDELGTLDYAIDYVARLAKIPGKPTIIKPEKRRGILSWLLGDYFPPSPAIPIGFRLQYLYPY